LPNVTAERGGVVKLREYRVSWYSLIHYRGERAMLAAGIAAIFSVGVCGELRHWRPKTISPIRRVS
jgi:hypothetical protein